MPRDLLIAIGAGVLSAIMSLVVMLFSSLTMMLMYLAPLPLYLVGLSRGTSAVVVATLVATIVIGLGVGLVAGTAYGIALALPTWYTVRCALMNRDSLRRSGDVEWFPAGELLTRLAAFGGLALAATALLLAGGDGLEAVVRSFLVDAAKVLLAPAEANLQAALVETLAPLFPGTLVVSWIITGVINVSLAQSLLVRFHHSLRPSVDIAQLTTTDWAAPGLAGAAAVALLGSLMGIEELTYLGRNLTLIMSVPFFFVGLGIAHALARRTPFPGSILGAVYVCVLVINPWAAVLLTGFGFVEQWVNLRARFATSDNDQEDK